ncbi:unnamed protein product [Plutella xylostella]|uniref:Autophagy-related protein 13 n=1 Tax=Plutella xylostella TaxID=51655 RepID=A0A8S4GCX4_PLUXY|nr:unnamed protein product [Plutella xylostella]
MSSDNISAHDRASLEKFSKFFTLKVAQIVVQSRQGKKIVQSNKDELILPEDSQMSPPPQAQLGVDSFNLAIPEVPEVTIDTKRVLNGEVVAALSQVFIVEISLTTSDGDEMILELWTIKMDPECDPAMNSLSTIYYRMGIMLKSTLTISRIVPAYKISRCQSSESYKISYRIYSGQPDTDLLGEGFRSIRVSELGTPCGTIQIALNYRTVMTLSPSKKPKTESIMVKSDHFPYDSPKKDPHEKRVIDLNKPLTAGAFVDTERIRELHDTLSQQLPPEPPMSWILDEKEKMDMQKKQRSISESQAAAKADAQVTSSSVPNASHSKAIEVPTKNRYYSESQKYSKMMEFPFADGSPITELANFYQECLHARSQSDEWCDIVEEQSASSDSDALSRQLKIFEDAVPEFDSMVASMFSNSENGEG